MQVWESEARHRREPGRTPAATTAAPPTRGAAILELQRVVGNRAVADLVTGQRRTRRIQRAPAEEGAATASDETRSRREGGHEARRTLRKGWELVKRTRAMFSENAFVKATEPEFMMIDGLLGLTDDELHQKLKEDGLAGRFSSTSEVLDAASDLIVGHIKQLMRLSAPLVDPEHAAVLREFGETAGAWTEGLESAIGVGANVLTLLDKKATADAKADSAVNLGSNVARVIKFAAELVEKAAAAAEGAGGAAEAAATEVTANAWGAVAVPAGAFAAALDFTWLEFKALMQEVYAPMLASMPIVGLHTAFALMRSTKKSLSDDLAAIDALARSDGASDGDIAEARHQEIVQLKAEMEDFLSQCQPAGPITSDNVVPGQVPALVALFRPYQAIKDVDPDDAATILTYARHLVAALEFASDTRNYGVSLGNGQVPIQAGQ